MYYNSMQCQKCNHCSYVQRRRCKKAYGCFNYETISKQILEIADKFNLSNRKFILHSNHSLEIVGEPLNCQILVYLSFVLNIHVFMKNGKGLKGQYYSTRNGGKPYIVKEEMV